MLNLVAGATDGLYGDHVMEVLVYHELISIKV